MVIKNKEKLIVALHCLFIFSVFMYISYLTPLAGDDWGYAINGKVSNPFILAYNFYHTWSGRYFSELWGFIVAPNKWLWNILNPIMFTTIFYNILKLTSKPKKYLINGIMILFLMLSVFFRLRIQTYTWIMGSTYVVPLMLYLIYLNIIKSENLNLYKFIIALFINFYIGLCMENIAAVLVFSNILFLIKYYKNKNFKKLIVLLIVSIISLLLLRLSPGSIFRFNRDVQDYSIIKQIGINWNLFIGYTFVNNRFLILTLSIIMVAFNFNKNKVLSMFFVIGIIFSLSFYIFNFTNITFFKLLFDIDQTKNSLLVCSIYYLLYVLFVFVSFYKYDYKDEAYFYVLIAGSANIVMLISPIFGPRSSLYTVYFLIILIIFVYNKISVFKHMEIFIFIFLLLFTLYKTKNLIRDHRLINNAQITRNHEIEFYKANPNEKEAWFIRMPINLMHSADIEEDDQYHMIVFKKYYGLNPDMKLNFYYK